MKHFVYASLLFAITSLLFFSSCSTAYVPNVVNTPLFGEKGEASASLNGGTSGLDVQLAYAVGDHLGLMANTSISTAESSTQELHKHIFGEIGSGYFTKIGNNGRFEAYGGLGYASYTRQVGNSFEQDGYYTRLFIQPAIGATSSIFQGSLATRLNVVNFRESDLNEFAFFIEPVVTLKIGYKYVYFVIQSGISIPIQPSGQTIELVQPFIINLGVQGNMNLMSKKKS